MASIFIGQWDDATADFDSAIFDGAVAIATESLVLTDSKEASPQVELEENIKLTEVSPSIVALGVVKSENIKAYDDRVIGITLAPLTENLALADTRAINLTPADFTEGLVMADSKALSAGVVKTESMIIDDSRIINAQSTLTENVALADNKTISPSVIKTENVALADDRDLNLTTVKTENVVLSDLSTNWANFNEPTMFYARADAFDLNAKGDYFDLKVTPGVA